jgi:hypothetical protein
VSSISVLSHEVGRDFPFKFAALTQRAEVTFVPEASHQLNILFAEILFRLFSENLVVLSLAYAMGRQSPRSFASPEKQLRSG